MAVLKLAPTVGDNNPPLHTFRDAADSYVTHGGEGRYLGRITDYFGDTGIRDDGHGHGRRYPRRHGGRRLALVEGLHGDLCAPPQGGRQIADSFNGRQIMCI